MSNNKLGATGAVEIAEKGLKGKTELIKLSIENNGICNAGVESISKNLKDCNSFQEIYLYNNDIDDDPIDMFVEFIQRQTDLYALGLEFNRLGYKSVTMILRAIVNHPKLEKLFLN